MKAADSQVVYQKLVEHMNEGVWMCDKNDYTVYANPKFCKMVEYSLDELKKMTEFELWDKESAEKIRWINAHERRKKGASSTYEGMLVAKSGKKIPILLSGTPLPKGGTMGMVTDLSQIKKQESVYKKLIEHMNEGVWMCDKNDYTVYANPKFCKMVEYSLDELKKMTEFELWDKESGDKVRWINAHERRKKGASSTYEGNLISKNKKLVPVLISGTPLPEGGTMGMVTDLSQIKKQESIYKLLIEGMNEAMCLNDANEKLVYANPKFCELMGYTLEEIIGKPESYFWDEETAKKVERVNLMERKKGIKSTYEGQLVPKSGEKIPVLVSGSPMPEGGTMGIFTDLREIKKKQESERILSHALQHTTDAIIVCDHRGRVKLWNTGAKNIFGYKVPEITHKSLEIIFSSDDLATILRHQRVLQNFELSARHKNKSFLKISLTATPLRGEEQKGLLSYLLIARDITHLAKFEEEITLKYQKLKEAYNQFGIVTRQMDYVFELLQVFSGSSDMNAVGDFIVNAVVMLTRVDACTLRRYNAEKNTLELLSCFGMSKDYWGNAVIPYKNSLTEKAAVAGHPLKIIDVSKEPKHSALALIKKHNLSSLLLIPLFYKSKFVGALSLYTTPEKKLEIFENEFIEKYSKLISIIIGNYMILQED